MEQRGAGPLGGDFWVITRRAGRTNILGGGGGGIVESCAGSATSASALAK